MKIHFMRIEKNEFNGLTQKILCHVVNYGADNESTQDQEKVTCKHCQNIMKQGYFEKILERQVKI